MLGFKANQTIVIFPDESADSTELLHTQDGTAKFLIQLPAGRWNENDGAGMKKLNESHAIRWQVLLRIFIFDWLLPLHANLSPVLRHFFAARMKKSQLTSKRVAGAVSTASGERRQIQFSELRGDFIIRTDCINTLNTGCLQRFVKTSTE